MAKFEIVSKYADEGFELPIRKTAQSAGYDLICAKDVIVPSLWNYITDLEEAMNIEISPDEYITMDIIRDIAEGYNFKPTLVSTGMKCELDPGTYLELSVRSSLPLKHWLIMANGVGVVDADYYNNPGNEGEIFLQLINLSPFNIKIRKGEAIGQGIIKPYLTTEDDVASGQRVGGFGSTNN